MRSVTRAPTGASGAGTAASGGGATSGLVMAAVILFWGLGPPISKLITAPAVISVLYRFWLSVPVLFGLAVLGGHRPTFDSVKKAGWAGAAFGINLVFVFLAINEAAVAVLSVIATLQPGIILILAGRFLGERATTWHVVWTLVGIGGTVVVVAGGGERFEVNLLAVVYALVSQLFFTVYFLITKHVRSQNDIDSVQWMAGVVLFAALAVTPWAVLTSSADDYRAVGGNDWIWLGMVIVFTGGLGHILMAWVHRFIDASRSSLYLLSMNVVAIVAAWFIHDEPLGPLQLLGGVVVFAAVGAVISRPAVPLGT